VAKILARRAVPVVPMALTGLWGSTFSRIENGRALAKPLRRGLFNRVGLEVGPALSATEATPEHLRVQVQTLLAR
jgi:hypothetical protein